MDQNITENGLVARLLRSILLAICLQLVTIQLYTQSIVENHLIHSVSLNEDRSISVSLPADYNRNNNKYPVLYLLDGEYIFNYARGTVDFLTNDFGYLPEMIVVSIPNTDRNRDLFVTLNPDHGYVNFVNFLQNEVFTFVSEAYRVNDFRILYGWSSGSGICSYLLTTEPNLVDAFILSGSGIGKRFEALMKEKITKDYFDHITYLYVNTEEGFRKPYLERFSMLMDSLHPNNLKYKFEVLEQSHVDVLQTGLDKGLKFIFNDFYIPEEKSKLGIDEVKTYYRELEDKYNFEFSIPMGAINEIAGILYYNEKKNDAFELLIYGHGLYPFSATLHGSIAELYKN